MFKLGVRGRNMINGFLGIVYGYAVHDDGNTLICLKPEKLKENGDTQDAIWFDSNEIEIINPEQIIIQPVKLKPAYAKLGQIVKDKTSGFIGIVVCINEWLNGCRKIGVQGPVNKDGKIPEVEWIAEEHLEIKEDSVIKKEKKKGGPSSALKSDLRNSL